MGFNSGLKGLNPKLSVRHAEGLPLATAEIMYWKTVGTFLKYV
jgi:hypothetical protein